MTGNVCYAEFPFDISRFPQLNSIISETSLQTGELIDQQLLRRHHKFLIFPRPYTSQRINPKLKKDHHANIQPLSQQKASKTHVLRFYFQENLLSFIDLFILKRKFLRGKRKQSLLNHKEVIYKLNVLIFFARFRSSRKSSEAQRKRWQKGERRREQHLSPFLADSLPHRLKVEWRILRWKCEMCLSAFERAPSILHYERFFVSLIGPDLRFGVFIKPNEFAWFLCRLKLACVLIAHNGMWRALTGWNGGKLRSHFSLSSPTISGAANARTM